MSRLKMNIAALITCLAMSAPFAAGDEKSRYDELIKSPGPLKTIRSLGLMIMAIPNEYEKVYPQIESSWWAKQPEVKMDDAVRKQEISRLQNQLKDIITTVVKHKIRRLHFIGFSQIGTIDQLDLFYAAETPSGPVIFRASVSTINNKPARLHELTVFKGWKESRRAIAQIHHKSGKTTLTMTLQPKEKPEDDKDREKPLDV